MEALMNGCRIRAVQDIPNKGILAGDLGAVRLAGPDLVQVQWDRDNSVCFVLTAAVEAVVEDDPLGVEDAQVVPVVPRARTRVKLMQNPEARDLELLLDDGWTIAFEQFVPMPREDLKGLMGIVYCVRLTKDEIEMPSRPKPIRSAVQKNGYPAVEVMPVDQPDPEPETDSQETGAPDLEPTALIVVDGPRTIPFEEAVGEPPAETPEPDEVKDQPEETPQPVEDDPVPVALKAFEGMTFSEALKAGASGEVLKAIGTKLALDKAKTAGSEALVGYGERTEAEIANLRRFAAINKRRGFPPPYTLPLLGGAS